VLCRIIYLLTYFFFLIHPGIATAEIEPAASLWVKEKQVALRLISSTNTIGSSENIKMGIQFKLKKGWKIYWRSPGDAGFPPSINWKNSKNLKNFLINWPSPKRFSIQDVNTIGYSDDVVLPILVNIKNINADLNIRALVDYLVCNKICIPYKADLKLSLPPGDNSPSPYFQLIDRYQALVPQNIGAHGLTIASATLSETGSIGKLEIIANSLKEFINPDLFVEGHPVLSYSKPQVILGPDSRNVSFIIDVNGIEFLNDKIGKTIQGRNFTFVLVDEGRSEQQTIKIQLAKNVLIQKEKTIKPNNSILLIIIFSLLGGLILNFMPCVLPVLSLKLIGLIKQKNRKNFQIKLSLFSSIIGIISSFVILAAGMAIAKSLGVSVGWGIQFQHPWFLITMSIILIFFTCNLWGFFEIKSINLTHSSSKEESSIQIFLDNFSQGALATLLATPCSAPFLGTAIGFALSQGTIEIFYIFILLGLGLSTPYIILLFFPKLVILLPRSGQWMQTLKRILGVTLIGTTIWLLYILTSLTSLLTAILLGFFLLIFILLIYIYSKDNSFKKSAIFSCLIIIILCFSVDLIISKPNTQNDKNTPIKSQRIKWEPFNIYEINHYVKMGYTVFVNITADWCVTCKINKTLILNQEPVLSALRKQNIIAMEADWTFPNLEVTNYLALFNRYGIPFNSVYGPKKTEGIVLPELLSQKSVMKALMLAKGKPNLNKIK